jgi:hypothetical protein
MSDPELERPDPSIAPLLRAEQERPPLDPAAVERIRRAAAAKLGGPPDGLGGPPSSGGGATGAAAATSTTLSHAIALAAGLTLGAAFGWAARGAPVERDGSQAPRTAPEPAALQVALVTTPESPPPEPPPPEPRAQLDDSAPARPGPETDDAPQPRERQDLESRTADDESLDPAALAAERRLIDAARAALTAGRPEAALQTLETHTRRHPHGALEEEREILRIEALLLTGRETDASAAARRFVSERPSSLYLGRVRALLHASEPGESGGDPGLE